MDAIPWPALTAAGGGWALFGIAGWLILRGHLVPRTTLEDARHDRDEWRAESRIKDAQIAEKDTQLAHVAEVGKTVDSIVHAMRRAQDQEAGT